MRAEEIVEIIVRHAREVVPGLSARSVIANDSLRALGANSVDRADIIAMTLDSLRLNVPLIDLAGARNIGDLARILHARL